MLFSPADVVRVSDNVFVITEEKVNLFKTTNQNQTTKPHQKKQQADELSVVSAR